MVTQKKNTKNVDVYDTCVPSVIRLVFFKKKIIKKDVKRLSLINEVIYLKISAISKQDKYNLFLGSNFYYAYGPYPGSN